MAHHREVGHSMSQWSRRRVDERFDGIQTVGNLRKLGDIGQERGRAWFEMGAAVIRICACGG